MVIEKFKNNYRSYEGSIEISKEDNCLLGQILNINDLIMYEGNTLPELELAFKKAVDEYIDTCKTLNR